eukprot:gene1857-2095_t
MIDSGSGSSYICARLLTQLKLKPSKVEKRIIEQMYGPVTRRVEIYKVKITSDVVEDFEMELTCINGEKEILTVLPNPRSKALKKKYDRFRCLSFSDEGAMEDMLPVHLILGTSDFQRIRVTEPLVLGPNPDRDPGAEITMLGWTLSEKTVSGEVGTEKGFFANSTKDEFKQLCSLEVLGLSDEIGDDTDSKTEVEDPTYAKVIVGTQPSETRILGIPWDTNRDEFRISIAKCVESGNGGAVTKRKMLSIINGVFDLLGIVSPVIITGKILYSRVCLKKLSWLGGKGTWTQFVRNRTTAIRERNLTKGDYVPTEENPSDKGTRGVAPDTLGRLWFNGPDWLHNEDEWPSQPEIAETPEAVCESLPKKEKQVWRRKRQESQISWVHFWKGFHIGRRCA